MKTRHLFPLLASALTSSILANGGGYLEGVKSTGPFRPVNVENVQMVSEKLDIELGQDAAQVSIVYELKNPGKAVTVEMGFPCSVAVPARVDSEYKRLTPELPQLQAFSLRADGEPAKSELMRDHAKLGGGEIRPGEDAEYGESILTGWQVVKLPFKAGQTRRVEVSYRNPYFRRVDSISDNSDLYPPSMRYLFSAAGLWSGPINKGEVTIRAVGVDPDVVVLSHGKRFQRSGSTWRWEFTDFEPTLQDDLEILAGEHEFHQSRGSEDGGLAGTYVMKGRSSDHATLQKSGRWFFIGRQYTATASSSLAADAGHTYEPANLNDNDWDNAWAEGAEGDGIGESLTLTMKKPVQATRLLVHNGYRTEKRELFEANNRVKKLAVSINGGKPFHAELPDGYEKECAIPIPKDAGPLRTVKLTIEEVYRGSRFRDTCITGIDVETRLTKAPQIFPCR